MMKQFRTVDRFDPMKDYVVISPTQKLLMELHDLNGVQSLKKARQLPKQKEMVET